MAIGYFLVAFIVFFFMYKKYGSTLIERSKRSYDPWIEFKEFWIISMVPLFWLFAIPLYFLWILLERIYAKFFEDKTGDTENR